MPDSAVDKIIARKEQKRTCELFPLAALWLGLCAATVAIAGPADESIEARPSLAPPTLLPCVTNIPGYLRGDIFGSVQRNLDWQAPQLLCDGMERPNGAGIRLVFDQNNSNDDTGLVIVVGVAEARLGEAATELSANITVIDQANSLFFSTQQEERCWVTFTRQENLSDATTETWRIDGRLFCAGALPELRGDGSITLGDLEFSGRVISEQD